MEGSFIRGIRTTIRVDRWKRLDRDGHDRLTDRLTRARLLTFFANQRIPSHGKTVNAFVLTAQRISANQHTKTRNNHSYFSPPASYRRCLRARRPSDRPCLCPHWRIHRGRCRIHRDRRRRVGAAGRSASFSSSWLSPTRPGRLRGVEGEGLRGFDLVRLACFWVFGC